MLRLLPEPPLRAFPICGISSLDPVRAGKLQRLGGGLGGLGAELLHSGCCVSTTCALGPSSGTSVRLSGTQPFSCPPASSPLLTDHLETLFCEEAVGDCHQCFWKVSAFFLLMHWSSLYSLDMDLLSLGCEWF